jgi:ubiquinone/menaquinone biosynthesis C-methylase UbiE
MNDNLKPIIRINELFHDFEGKEYQKKHADIFSDEVERWQNACKPIFSNHNSPYNILDIGTGTGFIPLTIAYVPIYHKKCWIFQKRTYQPVISNAVLNT